MIGMGILSDFCRKHKLTYNIILIIVFAVLAFLSSFFLWHSHYVFGAADIQFHLRRLVELETSLRHGQVLPMFSFNMFHGSAVMSLYPDINLLPIAFLSLFIKSNFALIYTFFSLNVFVALTLSYYCSLRFSKSKKISLLFAILYSSSIPFLAYGFYNMDMGEVTSMAVLPLVIFGAIYLIDNDRWLLLSVGMTLLVFSHILSVVIALGFLFFFLIVNCKRIGKTVGINLLKCGLLTGLLSSIVWVPFLHTYVTNYSNLIHPGYIPLSVTGIVPLIVNGIVDHITYNLGFMSIIGIIVSFACYKHFNSYTKKMCWITWLYLIICSKFFPWGFTNHGLFTKLRIFQFSWRLYIIPTILLSYILAAGIVKWTKRTGLVNGTVIGFIIMAVMLQIGGQIHFVHNNANAPVLTKRYLVTHTHDYKCYFSDFVSPGNNKMTGANHFKISSQGQFHRLLNINIASSEPDYYPKNSLSKLNYVNNNKATYGHDRTINVRHTGYNRFSFNSPKRINRLALPLLHYNGEHLRVYVNHHLVHSHANGNSLVTLDNVKKGRSVVGVRSVPNVWWIALKCILFISGVILVMWNEFKDKIRGTYSIVFYIYLCCTLLFEVPLLYYVKTYNTNKDIAPEFFLLGIFFIFCIVIEYILVHHYYNNIFIKSFDEIGKKISINRNLLKMNIYEFDDSLIIDHLNLISIAFGEAALNDDLPYINCIVVILIICFAFCAFTYKSIFHFRMLRTNDKYAW